MSGTLAALTSPQFELLVRRKTPQRPLVALLPIGSVEPHGPHLPLATDEIISVAAAKRAIERCGDDAEQGGITCLLAPSIPYGVTNCAHGFSGAVSIPAQALSAYVAATAQALLAAGFDLVCVINNHLEPEHDAALRSIAGSHIVLACPLTRKWARTLSAEFKSGQCHAGEYETSIVMAAAPQLVDETIRSTLPSVPISLSDGLRSGQTTFAQMGMTQAYAGQPAAANASHGEQQIDLLATMVLEEIAAALVERPPV